MSKCNMEYFDFDEVLAVGELLGVSWALVSPEEFCMGMQVEMEHRDVTGGDPILTGKIALAHLNELPDYYTRIEEMERAVPKRNGGRGRRR